MKQPSESTQAQLEKQISNTKPHFDKSENVGVKHFLNAYHFSMMGLSAALKHEAAFRQELALCTVMLPLSFWVGGTVSEIAILIFVCIFVLVVELLNSAVEAAIDRIGSEFHELSGRAKDLGSAAVMVSLFAAGFVWLIVILGNWDRLFSAF